MLKNKKEIESTLAALKDVPCTRFSRAANMLCAGFGKDVQRVDFTGKNRIVSEFALHVQCAWRLTFKNQILIAYGDFYIPREGLDYTDFVWDVQGNNRFDEKAKMLSSNFSLNPVCVTSITADEIGGVNIYFNNGYALEIFPHDSLGDEYWRFIRFNSDDGIKSEHFVMPIPTGLQHTP